MSDLMTHIVTDFHLEKYVYLGSKTYIFLLVGIILVFTQRAFNAFIKFRIFQKYLEWVGKQIIFLPGLRLDLKILENFVSNTYWMRQKSSWKSFLRGFWLDESDMRRSIEAKSWDNGICIKIRKLFNCEPFDLAFRVWRKWYLQCSLSAATVSVDFNVLLNYFAICSTRKWKVGFVPPLVDAYRKSKCILLVTAALVFCCEIVLDKTRRENLIWILVA